MNFEHDQFVQTCREALRQFDHWTRGLNEEKIRVNFRRLAQIRESLNTAIRDAQEMGSE